MEIYCKKIVNPERHFTIIPFGDLQFGDEGFNESLWDKFKKESLQQRNPYYIGMGDYSNTFRPTIRKNIAKVLQEDPEAFFELERMVKLEMEKLADKMKFMKGKLIGLLEGHHKVDFLDGTSSTQYLCNLLGTKFLGFVSIIRLKICIGNIGNKRKEPNQHIDIFATHGCGGSQFSSTDLANLERRIMPYWDCELFIRGHSTKVYAAPGAPLNTILFNKNENEKLKIVKKQRWLINTGGFMDGYVQGKSSYVEEKNMPPAALGFCFIEVHRQSCNDYKSTQFLFNPKIYTE